MQELSLAVVQRENVVDRARATLNLDTSVRTARKRELKQTRENIAKLEKVHSYSYNRFYRMIC